MIARSSGLLLHVSSLPSAWGIGDFGSPAVAWIDRLADAGQSWWQFLPLSPPGRGNSPYEPFSTFALNELFLSPEWLCEDGLLKPAELPRPLPESNVVDYPAVNSLKDTLLVAAQDSFRRTTRPELRHDFEQFCHEQAGWLDDYALFRALRIHQGDREFHTWPGALKRHEPAALTEVRKHFFDLVDRFRLAQFLAYRQLRRLREHARERGVGLIGDVPFFVSPDSSDVWAHPELFLLDAERQPRFIAGVPPDYFSADGQLWGDPLYDWDTLRRTGYEWWLARIATVLSLVDVVRLDHFRAFAAAWHVPAGAATAINGEWRPGPGADFLSAVKARLGSLPLIAEDLGLITPDVIALRDQFDLPGMRVLQFALDGDPQNPFLPEHYPEDVVAYTATHDNQTTRAWYESLSDQARQRIWDCLGHPIDASQAAWELIRLIWESKAMLAVAPVQDLLNLGADARMNWPGRPADNWRWRATAEQIDSPLFERLRDLTRQTGRSDRGA
ncbi:MAG TPA: 4-alpha-glucanotransferase [Planctomycetaceae bacterium]|nr:4-alpha-glucanotransferase [Planctomycetaceae bacterium]